MRNWKSVLPALLLIPALAAGMLSSASSVYPEAVWAEEIQEAEELFPEPEESGPEGGEEEDSLPEAVSDEEAPVSGPEGSGEDEAAFPESSGEATIGIKCPICKAVVAVKLKDRKIRTEQIGTQS